MIPVRPEQTSSPASKILGCGWSKRAGPAVCTRMDISLLTIEDMRNLEIHCRTLRKAVDASSPLHLDSVKYKKGKLQIYVCEVGDSFVSLNFGRSWSLGMNNTYSNQLE